MRTAPLDLSPATDTVITSGNLGIGTTAFGSGATNVVMLANGSPSSGVQDAAFIYAGGGEMFAGDQDGNTSQISPHPSEDIEALADPKDPYPLFEKCSNRYIGKEIVVDKGKAFRLLQTLFPDEEFIWYREVPRVDPVTAQREWWKRKWIRENTREVEITKSEAFETVTVDVEDTGSGIPSKSLPRIFERFYRADTSRAREVGGTGLGLAIVRHLVQAMGGDVSVRSELGRGTTLRFTLPRAWPDDADDPPPETGM